MTAVDKPQLADWKQSTTLQMSFSRIADPALFFHWCFSSSGVSVVFFLPVYFILKAVEKRLQGFPRLCSVAILRETVHVDYKLNSLRLTLLETKSRKSETETVQVQVCHLHVRHVKNA